MIQNQDIIVGFQCKKCKKFIPFDDEDKLTTHKDRTSSIRTNKFHKFICKCESQELKAKSKNRNYEVMSKLRPTQ